MCKLGRLISDKGQDNKFKDLIDPDFPLLKWTSKGLVDLSTSANIGGQLLTVSRDGHLSVSSSLAWDHSVPARSEWMTSLMEKANSRCVGYHDPKKKKKRKRS